MTPADAGAAGSALFDLSGRVAAVIGGTGLLGGAICHGLGEAGAAVAVMGRSRERADARVAALEAIGIRAAAVIVDASDRTSVERARLEVEERLGPVDILVNGAGVNSSPAARLGEPGDLVGTVVWLASERGSGFVTGALIHVDGGFSAMTI